MVDRPPKSLAPKGKLRVLNAEPVGEAVIAKLEEALKEARNGELSSVALAVVYRSGATCYSWSKACSVSLLIGSVARLQAALINFLEES